MPVDDAERERRRALHLAHLDAENANDVDAVMSTFDPLPEISLVVSENFRLDFPRLGGAEDRQSRLRCVAADRLRRHIAAATPLISIKPLIHMR